MQNFRLEDLFHIVITVAAFVVVGVAFEYRAQIRAFIMSRLPDRPVRESVPEVVHVPVPPTSTNAQPAQPAKVVLADTDAPNGGTGWELPRVSRTLSDRDIIITLAVQRAGGKYRFSANQIHTLAGGPRAEVLALVKLVREGPAEYRPLTPEQQALRERLELHR